MKSSGRSRTKDQLSLIEPLRSTLGQTLWEKPNEDSNPLVEIIAWCNCHVCYSNPLSDKDSQSGSVSGLRLPHVPCTTRESQVLVHI